MAKERKKEAKLISSSRREKIKKRVVKVKEDTCIYFTTELEEYSKVGSAGYFMDGDGDIEPTSASLLIHFISFHSSLTLLVFIDS